MNDQPSFLTWLLGPWGCRDCNRMHRRAQAAESETLRVRAALEWYATVPRDDDGATMPLDTGERARAALRSTSASPKERT